MAQFHPQAPGSPPPAQRLCRRCGCIPRPKSDGSPRDRCPRCQRPLRPPPGKRRPRRPATIACRRCGARQRVGRRGPVPQLCASCNRRASPSRPTEGRCPACGAAFRICDRGPVPTHCEECRGGEAVRRHRDPDRSDRRDCN